jgi:outer membrane protein TolC
MSQKPAAAKRVRLFADAMEMDAGQVLTPADFDAIAKVIHSELTELRTNSKCGAMGFAGVAAALACNLLSACAFGPDFVAPSPLNVTGYTKESLKTSSASCGSGQGQGQRFVEKLDIAGQWWEIFHSRPLNDLVEDALKHNPNVQAAQAGLRVARETTEAQKGAFAPQISAGYNSFNQKAPGGGIGRGAGRGAAISSRGNLSHAHLQCGGGGHPRGLAAGSNRRHKKDHSHRIRPPPPAAHSEEIGSSRGADVALQEAALAQAEETLPPLEKQLALQRDLLTALAGCYPSEEVAEKFTLASLRLPHELPVSLPSKVVEQRPDVRAASATLHSTSAAIGVAIANRLPLINLTPNLATGATDLALLFAPPSNAYLLTAAVVAPVFDGFTLYHKQRAAEAADNQAEAQYRSTVVTAFQNVADTLRAIQADARAMTASVKAEDAAAKSLAIVRKQFELGQVSTLAVLTRSRPT